MDLKALKQYKCPWLIDEQEDDMLEAKYGKEAVIRNSNQLREHDLIEVYDTDEEKSFIGKFLASYKSCIYYKSETGETRIASLITDFIYSIHPSREVVASTCQCGAEHTSNKSYHLSYCPVGK